MPQDDLIIASWLMAGKLPNGRRLQRFFALLPALVFVGVLALSPVVLGSILQARHAGLRAYVLGGSVLALLVSLLVTFATLSTLTRRAHVTPAQPREARASGQSVVSWRYVELALVAALVAFALASPALSWSTIFSR